MADKLVEIEPKHWPELKQLYTPDGSKSYLAYTTIDIYIRWYEQNPNLKYAKFYCLNGDYSDGTFVVIDWSVAYADTFDVSNGNLSKLLDLIDYTKVYTFISIRAEVRPLIPNSMRKANADLLIEHELLLYRLQKEKALEFDPPEGITLRPITDAHDIEKANSVWPLCDHISLGYFQRYAKYNANVGAFEDDRTLVAWIFRYESGVVAALQTDEKYFGRGYGSLVTKSLSKVIAEMGHDIFAGIFESNVASRTFFGKLGFEAIGKIYKITTKYTPGAWDE